jgi:WD40 repeat protein
MAFSPDGHTALTASNIGGWTVHKLQLWDLTIDQRLRQIPIGSLPTNPELQAHFLRISPDEQTALISTMMPYGGEGPCPLMLVDMQTGQEIHRFEAPTELEDSCPQDVFFSTHGMAFSPDGRMVVEAKHYGPVIFWDVDPASPTFGEALHVRLDHGDWALGASFSSDGRMALTGGREHAIIWDVESGEVIRRIDGLSGSAAPGAFSPDGRTVLIGATGGRMSLYDLATGEEIWRAEGLTGWPMNPVFTPDGDMFLVSDAEGDLKLFDAGTGELIQHMRDKGRQNGYRYFSPDGRYIFSGLPEGITQWDFARGKAVRHYPTGGGGIDIEFALSADGKSFYVLDNEGGVLSQWRIDTHEELVAWVEANRYVRELTCKERADYGIEPLCE